MTCLYNCCGVSIATGVVVGTDIAVADGKTIAVAVSEGTTVSVAVADGRTVSVAVGEGVNPPVDVDVPSGETRDQIFMLLNAT